MGAQKDLKNLKKVLDTDPKLLQKIIEHAKNNILSIRMEQIQEQYREEFQSLITRYYDFIKKLKIFNGKLRQKLFVYRKFKHESQEYVEEVKERLLKEIEKDRALYEEYIQEVGNLITESSQLFAKRIFLKGEYNYYQLFSFVVGCIGLLVVVISHIALPILLPFDGLLVGMLSTIFFGLGLPALFIVIGNTINWFTNYFVTGRTRAIEDDIKRHLVFINEKLGTMSDHNALLLEEARGLGLGRKYNPNGNQKDQTERPIFSPETISNYAKQVEDLDRILLAALM